MKFIVGIDEVGRGPLAGPVTVCAVVCEEKIYLKLKKFKELPLSGKDSKKINRVNREKYAKVLEKLEKSGQISYSISNISNKIIDSKGISYAIKLAIEKCIQDLKVSSKKSSVLLDGGLKAPLVFKNQKTIIKGDEKEKIIAWASILAKVSRDTFMIKLGNKFPTYGFDIHKGYGTKKHRTAIKINGLSHFHRVTFCRSIDFST
jgi:ribonuclease HII